MSEKHITGGWVSMRGEPPACLEVHVHVDFHPLEKDIIPLFLLCIEDYLEDYPKVLDDGIPVFLIVSEEFIKRLYRITYLYTDDWSFESEFLEESYGIADLHDRMDGEVKV